MLAEGLGALQMTGHRARCVHPAAKLAELRLSQGRLEEAELLLAGFEELPEAAHALAALHLARGELAMAAALLHRRLNRVGGDGVLAAPFLGLLVDVQLAEGAVLSTFRGTETSGRKAADLVAGLLTRACLSALTVRVLAEEAGLARELDPARVSQASWYPREFKPRIYPKLLAKAQEMPELGLADRSPWSLQASFRLAASFSTKKLATAVADLLRFGALRAEGLEPWAPVVLAYASLFAASNSS
uniref:Uncharacterized protein n=1 Tax=Thermoanaerobaculum aquaticum TaxID=1312852 RepID=A0A7V1ZIU2_9BACT